MAIDVVAGIFVGGQSRRMQGVPKGLLQPPNSSEALVTRLVRRLAEAQCHDVVLVGKNAAYEELGLPFVADAGVGRGPAAGLLGLVQYASERRVDFVLALACDMPNLGPALLMRLMVEAPGADALVPRRKYWEPLCARYRVATTKPLLLHMLSEGRLRMRDLLEALGAGCVALELEPAEHGDLTDWDSPGDLPEGVVYSGSVLGRRGRVP